MKKIVIKAHVPIGDLNRKKSAQKKSAEFDIRAK